MFNKLKCFENDRICEYRISHFVKIKQKIDNHLLNRAKNMLQLHLYSDYAGRLVLDNEYHDWWSFDTYPLESIKEFEQISEAWKKFLADILRKGLKCSDTQIAINVVFFNCIS